MNINALKTLLDNGEPFADDAAALVWVNDTVTVHGTIDYSTLISWLADGASPRTRKIYTAKLEIDAGTSALTNAQQSDVLTLWTAISSGGDLDLTKAEMRSLLNRIDGDVVISNTDKTALLALSDSTKSRWEAGRHDDGPQSSGFSAARSDGWKLHHINRARSI